MTVFGKAGYWPAANTPGFERAYAFGIQRVFF